MEQGDTRLLVDIGELRDHNAMLAQNVLDNPAAWLPSFDKALAEKVADLNPEYGRENKVRNDALGINHPADCQFHPGEVFGWIRGQLWYAPRNPEEPECSPS